MKLDRVTLHRFAVLVRSEADEMDCNDADFLCRYVLCLLWEAYGVSCDGLPSLNSLNKESEEN